MSVLENPNRTDVLAPIRSRIPQWIAADPEFARRYALGPKSVSWLSHTKKTDKSKSVGVLTGVLYLSPAKEAGIAICPSASPACIRTCLGHSSGRMSMSTHELARKLRTAFLVTRRSEVLTIIADDIRKLVRRAERLGMKPAVRLNGTSDIDWTLPEFSFNGECPNVGDLSFYRLFPNVQFYEYTKRPDLVYSQRNIPNLELTFSRHESTPDSVVATMLRNSVNVAVLYRGKLPTTMCFDGTDFPVVDGDEFDARFLDAKGVIVGLTAKGAARKDHSGFVLSMSI